MAYGRLAGRVSGNEQLLAHSLGLYAALLHQTELQDILRSTYPRELLACPLAFGFTLGAGVSGVGRNIKGLALMVLRDLFRADVNGTRAWGVCLQQVAVFRPATHIGLAAPAYALDAARHDRWGGDGCIAAPVGIRHTAVMPGVHHEDTPAGVACRAARVRVGGHGRGGWGRAAHRPPGAVHYRIGAGGSHADTPRGSRLARGSDAQWI